MADIDKVHNTIVNYRRLLRCKKCDLTFALLTLPLSIPQNEPGYEFSDDNTWIATSVMNLKPRGPVVAIEDLDVDQGSIKYRDMICVKCEEYIGIRIEELEVVPKENANSIIETSQSTATGKHQKGATYMELFDQCQIGWCLIPHSHVNVENVIKPDTMIDVRLGYGGVPSIESCPELCENSQLWHDREAQITKETAGNKGDVLVDKSEEMTKVNHETADSSEAEKAKNSS